MNNAIDEKTGKFTDDYVCNLGNSWTKACEKALQLEGEKLDTNIQEFDLNL